MSDEERSRELAVRLAAEVVDLSARELALRDIVVQLLAHVIKDGDGAEAILKAFSTAGDEQVDRLQTASPAAVATSEAIRVEKDRILRLVREKLGLPSS